MGHPIVHWEILGKDASRLQKFYADLLDWNVGPAMGPEMGHYALVDQASAGIGGGIGASQDGKPSLVIYAEVADLQATLDRAVAMGGRIVQPPMEIPNMVTFAQFADPEGNVVGLVKSQS